MTELQLSNFKVVLDDEKIRFSTTAGTWAMEISILSPRYLLLQSLICNTEHHGVLEDYIRFNYMISESVIFDKKFAEEFLKMFNGNILRYNKRFNTENN
jgi:hypothetical protein